MFLVHSWSCATTTTQISELKLTFNEVKIPFREFKEEKKYLPNSSFSPNICHFWVNFILVFFFFKHPGIFTKADKNVLRSYLINIVLVRVDGSVSLRLLTVWWGVLWSYCCVHTWNYSSEENNFMAVYAVVCCFPRSRLLVFEHSRALLKLYTLGH